MTLDELEGHGKVFTRACINSNRPLIALTEAVAIHFSALQLTSGGTGSSSIEAAMHLNGCRYVMGDVFVEQTVSGAATLDSYIKLTDTRQVDLRVMAYGSREPATAILLRDELDSDMHNLDVNSDLEADKVSP